MICIVSKDQKIRLAPSLYAIKHFYIQRLVTLIETDFLPASVQLLFTVCLLLNVC